MSGLMLGSTEEICFHPVEPPTAVSIEGSNGEVGRLDWKSGQLTFSGDMAESAQIFFNDFLKPMVDEYLRREAHGN